MTYLLQCVFISLPGLEITTILLLTFMQKNIPCEYSNKTYVWATDNLVSVDRLFLSVID